MELSINFLVIMILALAVFGFGIFMTSKFFGAAQQQKDSIDRDTEKSIQNLLSSGAKVVVPLNRKEFKIGNSDIFGLGILNAGGLDKIEFKVKVSFNKAFKPNNLPIVADSSFINNNWILYESEHEILNNEHSSVAILVDVNNKISSTLNTEKGTYIFNVCVCRAENENCNLENGCNLAAGDLYGGSMKKFYVEVK